MKLRRHREVKLRQYDAARGVLAALHCAVLRYVASCKRKVQGMIYETVLAHYGDDAEVTDRTQGVIYEDGFTCEGDVLVKHKGREKTVVIPDGVRVIGPSAFAGNPFVKHIVIPEGVETIGRWAFYYCTSLHSVEIPSTVKTIDEEAFRLCRMLDKVQLPYGLETIESLTFSGCAFLRKVSMPASVQVLGARAFWGCKRLEEVTLGGRVVPPALLDNEFRPPLRAVEPFPGVAFAAGLDGAITGAAVFGEGSTQKLRSLRSASVENDIDAAGASIDAGVGVGAVVGGDSVTGTAAAGDGAATGAACSAFASAAAHNKKRQIPPELHVAWRTWLAAGNVFPGTALDGCCYAFLREQGDKVCAALGYDAQTMKFMAKQQLLTKECALRAAAECSARGFVEATALLMELARGLSADDGLDL